MLINDDDITVEEPCEAADELITPAGCFPQQTGHTAVIAGFVRVTRLFRIISRILGLIRISMRADQPPMDSDQGRAAVNILARDLQNEMVTLPPALDLLADPIDPPNEEDRHAFGTCRANLLVTHALARFELYQLAFLYGVYDHELDPMTVTVLQRLDK